MTEARVTQGGTRIVAVGDPEAQITQAGARVVSMRDGATARATQVGVKAVVRVKPPRSQKAMRGDVRYTRGAGIAGDPHYDKVELLMSCDDQGVQDLSKKRRSLITYAGGVRIDSAQKASGSHSLYSYRHNLLTGGSANYGAVRVVGGSSDDFWFSSKPFTIDVKIRTTGTWNNTIHANRTIVAFYGNAGERCWWLRVNQMGIEFIMSADGVNTTILSGPTVTPDIWQHIRVDRDVNGRVRMYANGVMTSFVDWNSVFYRPSQATKLSIGGMSAFSADGTPNGSAGGLGGWIDDLRITVGVARTGSDAGFEVPAILPAVPLPDLGIGASIGDPYWDNVSLLLDANDGLTPIDKSPVGATITGSPTRATDVFWGDPNNQAYNITSAQRMTVDTTPGQFDFDGPFTAEAVARFTTSGFSATSRILECNRSWLLRSTRSGIQFMIWDGVSLYQNEIVTGDFPLWYDVPSLIAIARDEAGITRMYINGTFIGQTSLALPPREGSFFVGPSDTTIRIMAARVTKGVCRYRGNDYAVGDMNWQRWPQFGAAGP